MLMPKYRAFIKEEKLMVEVDVIDFRGKQIKTFDPETVCRYYNFYDIVLMQSTGLNDKNGVGLYKWDIVKLNVDINKYDLCLKQGIYLITHYGYGSFFLESINVPFGIRMRLIDCHCLDQLDVTVYGSNGNYPSVEDIEVRGNKFEHAHLLDGE